MVGPVPRFKNSQQSYALPIAAFMKNINIAHLVKMKSIYFTLLADLTVWRMKRKETCSLQFPLLTKCCSNSSCLCMYYLDMSFIALFGKLKHTLFFFRDFYKDIRHLPLHGIVETWACLTKIKIDYVTLTYSGHQAYVYHKNVSRSLYMDIKSFFFFFSFFLTPPAKKTLQTSGLNHWKDFLTLSTVPKSTLSESCSSAFRLWSA